MDSFVLSVIGADRTGLVQALSDVVAAHGGSWDESRMTELAGMFAGMALVRVPPDRAEAFRSALEPLRERGMLDVALREAAGDDLPSEAPTMRFEVVGADRVGILREVSTLLASLGVGILDLHTTTESAAMAGSPLFRATAYVRLPADVPSAAVTAALETLSDDLIVDVVD